LLGDDINYIQHFFFSQRLNDNLRKRYQDKKRTPQTQIHVSDIVPQNCMRKSFYNRTSQQDITISNTMMHHWVRGEGMEHILTTLSGIGVS